MSGSSLNKTAAFSICFIFSFFALSQWKTKVVDNGFDPKFKIAYTPENNNSFLKLTRHVTDEEKYISDTIHHTDTVYKFMYSPEYPDGKNDTLINNWVEYKYKWKENGIVSLSIVGGFHCTERPRIEIVFIVNGKYKKYTNTGETSSDNRDVVLIGDLFYNSDLKSDFENASHIKIRINDEYCPNDYYEFSMSGSTKALNFISTKI